MEEGRERPPGPEDVQKSTKPLVPEGSRKSDADEYQGDEPLRPARNEQKKKKKKDEQDREIGRRPVREQGRDRELSRPPRDEVLDKSNTVCSPCRIDFGGRMPFLEHYLLVHQRKRRTKNSGRIPTPSPQRRSPSHPLTSEPEVSDRSRGCQSSRPSRSLQEEVPRKAKSPSS